MTVRQIRRVALKVLPRFLHVYIIKSVFTQDHIQRFRNDLVRLPLNDDAFLDVYWKQIGIGSGPSILLNVSGRECIKFDCYGKNAGHYHIEVIDWKRNSPSRILLSETTRENQIDRAVFELSTNLRWYLDRHPFAKVRRFHPEKDLLKTQLEIAKLKLMSYIERSESITDS